MNLFRHRSVRVAAGALLVACAFGLRETLKAQPAPPARDAAPAGKKIYDVPPAAHARTHARQQLSRLSMFSRRLQNPHEYPVGLEQGLAERRLRLIRSAKEHTSDTRGGKP